MPLQIEKNIERTPHSLLANFEILGLLLVMLAILYFMLSPVLDRAHQQGNHQPQDEPAVAAELD